VFCWSLFDILRSATLLDGLGSDLKMSKIELDLKAELR
jgi:hypothetical protein